MIQSLLPQDGAPSQVAPGPTHLGLLHFMKIFVHSWSNRVELIIDARVLVVEDHWYIPRARLKYLSRVHDNVLNVGSVELLRKSREEALGLHKERHGLEASLKAQNANKESYDHADSAGQACQKQP